MMNSSLYTKNFHMTIQTLIKAIEQTGDNVMITDKANIIQYVNPAFQKTTGYSKAEVLGRNPKILKSGKHDKEYYEKLWSTILSGRIFRSQTTNKNKKGELYIADQTISSIKDEQGEITHFVSVWKDITERKKLEDKLKIERLKLEEIVGFDEKVSRIRKLDRLIDFVMDKTAKILEAEKCSLMLLDNYHHKLCIKGYKGLDEKHIFETKIKVGDPFAGTVIENGIPIIVKEIENDKKYKDFNKPSYLAHTFIIVPIKLAGQVIGVINVANKNVDLDGRRNFNDLDLKILCAISREVAVAIENVRLYKELHHLTVTDPLTHIYNFRQFRTSLHHEVNRAKRFAGSLFLMMIDIDNFKSYNDSFGHLEGDELLKKVSEILTKNLREIDIICRYAGDEFAVILPETDVNGARTVANKIKSEIEKYPFKQKVTLSIGLAKKGNMMNDHDLIQRSDIALYKAKDSGKNQVCVYG